VKQDEQLEMQAVIPGLDRDPGTEEIKQNLTA
jgi:hypothetical protein